MKQKNNSLFSRLRNWIDEIPMVDIHSHIDRKHPNATDARQIIFYEYIFEELVSSGAPLDIFSPNIPIEKAIKRAIPWLPLIQNTSTYWCLMTMLRDLYGFKSENITKRNWKNLLETINERIEEKSWYRRVLIEKAKIKKTFLTLKYKNEIPDYTDNLFVGALRIDPLITLFSRKILGELEETVDYSIESISDFENSLDVLFKRFEGKCVAITASFPPDQIFKKVDKDDAEKPFKKVILGLNLNASEKQIVSSFALYKVLNLAQEFNLPFQMMLGARMPVPGALPPDYAISGFAPKMLSSFCPIFLEFNRIKFDIFLANTVQSHELTVIAKNYPNVYVSGFWWYVFYPTFIEKFLRERLQMLPRNKTNCFFSDAPVVEWSYAKSCLVRFQLTTVLTDIVKKGFFTEEFAKNLAVDLLAHNAEKLYRLK